MQNGKKNSSTATRKVLALLLAKLTIDKKQLIDATTHPVLCALYTVYTTKL